MFRFFKRKKNTEPAVEQPVSTPSQPEIIEQPQDATAEPAPAETTVKTEAEPNHPTTAEAAPADEATAQPATETAEEIIVPTVVDEPAAIVTTTETAPIQTATSENAVVIPVAPAATSSEADKPAKLGWAARLKQGLSKSRNHMAKSLAAVFGGGKIDEDLYEELETVLLTSDMGIEATEKLLAQVRQRVTLKGLKNGNELRSALKEALYELLLPLQQPLILPTDKKPFVIMMAGVNGAGKTTSIGKLAKYFQGQGKSVLLAAGDTFRAAAREQLQQWGERNNVTVIAQESGDSAAVCFDALEAAKARGIDVVLADTAGRLPTQLHLMEEIKKVKRVLQKSLPEAPHEVMLVLDANVGQNAINQVVSFDDALGLTGLIVSKLDGTAKGGILAALAAKRPIPVRFIGVGEGIDDLRPFDARAFVDALIEDEE
ncbi:signal recognition particle-docking protein FtsY [Snodgrassella communis]|uniref:signal recognition particle-docking protein FtsY n=1 Tax=Snodgrassella communis TaxID=2946699 RepID=UPI001EF6989F|nr:signal recognition particle-docking protein FtsY [Snodgrassella communis]